MLLPLPSTSISSRIPLLKTPLTRLNPQLNVAENFDDHFQRRKKELHDAMMKRLSQNESKNQTNPAGGTTTTPYASGKDVLKIMSNTP